jgi:hypothetical protein
VNRRAILDAEMARCSGGRLRIELERVWRRLSGDSPAPTWTEITEKRAPLTTATTSVHLLQ